MKSKSSLSKFDELFSQYRFFELRDEVAIRAADNSTEMLFFRGAVANKFNRIAESTNFLEKYLSEGEPDDKKLCSCYELLGDNFAKSYQYKSAGEKYGWLINNFADAYEGEKRQHLEYQNSIWNAARGVLPQKVTFKGDTHFQAFRTKSNHIEIPIELDGQKTDFVFDTAANISCVTASVAGQFGLQIIDRDISIGTSTDIRITGKLAVANTLMIGNIELENVILLVVQDKDLYFEKHDYQVRGIIGYPVLQALRRVSITADEKFFIPQKKSLEQLPEQNLCFDDMMPLLNVLYKNELMSFIFDTGARKSQFWSKFFESQKAEIEKTGKPQSIDFGGVGGRRNVRAYILDKIPFTFMEKTKSFNEAQVFAEAINDLQRNFHGIIGRDFMTHWNKLTVDFEVPGVLFE